MKKKLLILILALLLALPVIPKTNARAASASEICMLKATAGNKKVRFTWTKVPAAKKYKLYFAVCGQKKYKCIKITAGRKFTKKGLKKGKNYKAYVVACDQKGKTLAKSRAVYIETSGGKNANATKVTAVKNLNLKFDGSAFVNGKITKKDKTRTLLYRHHCRKLRYVSSNPSAASVNASGKVTATGEGTAIIYTIAPSGVYAKTKVTVAPKYTNGQQIGLDPSWTYATNSKINSGKAVMYKATVNRNNIIVGINAGHGTKGGSKVKTLCHPDGSPKVSGGTTAKGATESSAVSAGMDFADGTEENVITLAIARIIRDKLLAKGYDVLMLRDDSDVQLDNVARSVIANNVADCHIALHWDGDELPYDKGCFFIGVAEGIRDMEPVKSIWQEHHVLGQALIDGLSAGGFTIYNGGHTLGDLTQIAYSTIPSVDIELGNETSDHSTQMLNRQADALVTGIDKYFGK